MFIVVCVASRLKVISILWKFVVIFVSYGLNRKISIST